MRLSIITINRNNADGLRKTIESVLSQTYRDIEHIVIDGASTDTSVDVIRASALQAEGLRFESVNAHTTY
ncbi:MAG: glycosyltransferase [Paludibacteraceae bacterium]|nr:glycosyltransferase [Paludibacteraceae bacterium]